MRGHTDISDVLLGIATVVVVLGSLGIMFAMPYFEARSFNECTGSNATYITALTTQLRVDNCNR